MAKHQTPNSKNQTPKFRKPGLRLSVTLSLVLRAGSFPEAWRLRPEVSHLRPSYQVKHASRLVRVPPQPTICPPSNVQARSHQYKLTFMASPYTRAIAISALIQGG